MQLGFTMFEKMHIDAGQITNASLADYKIPAILDLPPAMVNEAVAADQSNGPFGGKGVGESATFCVSPAIGNAIEDACGVRLTDLPVDPEAVLRALRGNGNQPRGRRANDQAHHQLHPQRRARNGRDRGRIIISSRCSSATSI